REQQNRQEDYNGGISEIFDPIYESENTLRDEPIVPREKANPLDMAIGMVYGLMNIKKRLRI
ncbi:hypothetical protein FOFC_13884, partial [Fusarium oxysporum]